MTQSLDQAQALILMLREAIQYVRDNYLFDVLCSYMHTSTLSSKSKCKDTTYTDTNGLSVIVFNPLNAYNDVI